MPAKTLGTFDLAAEAPGLARPEVVRMLRCMLVARAIDDRIMGLVRQGRARFGVTSAGHEALSAAYGVALRAGHDWAHGHYRDLAGLLAVGMTSREVMAYYLSKDEDPVGGGRMPYAHWSLAAKRIGSMSGIQPQHITHAVGIAYGHMLAGEDVVVWTACGDGGASKGEWHEAMNFAAVQQCPIVFCVENNQWCISAPLSKQTRNPDIVDRAKGYGMPGVQVDGMDPLATYRAAHECIERARQGGGPSLIEAKTYRLNPNTSNDYDEKYRSRDEVAEWRKRDSVPVFRQKLLDVGLLDATSMAELEQSIKDEVNDATRYALDRPFADPATIFNDSYTGAAQAYFQRYRGVA
ncbi:MAG: thiamine pyrophosphate-dependent dehydrogenase E1 component subunit alpha [Chloroflexota bacterium]